MMSNFHYKNINTLFCIDDDDDDVELLKEALEAVGATQQVAKAGNGEEALELLQKMKQNYTLPCLIVLDINMPRLEGRETLIDLQKDEVLKTIPVVVFTTTNNEVDKAFFHFKNVKFITKPVDFYDLKNIVLEMLTYCKLDA
jgi:CheY-like chemotaxis protein